MHELRWFLTLSAKFEAISFAVWTSNSALSWSCNITAYKNGFKQSTSRQFDQELNIFVEPLQPGKSKVSAGHSLVERECVWRHCWEVNRQTLIGQSVLAFFQGTVCNESIKILGKHCKNIDLDRTSSAIWRHTSAILVSDTSAVHTHTHTHIIYCIVLWRYRAKRMKLLMLTDPSFGRLQRHLKQNHVSIS